MVSQASAMLDELMGKYRNAMPDEKPPELHWTDKQVCRHYLVDYCPHDLFTNTRSDLGPCPGVHDEQLKERFRRLPSEEREPFEDEFVAFLSRVKGDMGKRIQRNKDRLAMTQKSEKEEMEKYLNDKEELQKKLDGVTEKIEKLIEYAEQAGAKGKVDDSMKAVHECEELKEERERMRLRLNLMNMGHPEAIPSLVGNTSSSDPLKMMEVCDICSCFLVIGDAQSRVDEHLLGKQHIGFSKINDTLDEFQKMKEDRIKRRGGGGTVSSSSKPAANGADKDRKSSRRRSASRDRSPLRRSDDRRGRSTGGRVAGRDGGRDDRDRDRHRRDLRDRDRDRRGHRDSDRRRGGDERRRDRRSRHASRSPDRTRRKSKSRSKSPRPEVKKTAAAGVVSDVPQEKTKKTNSSSEKQTEKASEENGDSAAVVETNSTTIGVEGEEQKNTSRGSSPAEGEIKSDD